MTKTYIYGGPVSGVTMGEREIMLHPGCEVELPEESEYTQILILRGLLTEVAVRVEQKEATDPVDNTNRRK